MIAGYPMRWISPEWLVKFHMGYELDHKEWHDVRLLCERFQIAVPDGYMKFIDDPRRNVWPNPLRGVRHRSRRHFRGRKTQ